MSYTARTYHGRIIPVYNVSMCVSMSMYEYVCVCVSIYIIDAMDVSFFLSYYQLQKSHDPIEERMREM